MQQPLLQTTTQSDERGPGYLRRAYNLAKKSFIGVGLVGVGVFIYDFGVRAVGSVAQMSKITYSQALNLLLGGGNIVKKTAMWIGCGIVIPLAMLARTPFYVLKNKPNNRDANEISKISTVVKIIIIPFSGYCLLSGFGIAEPIYEAFAVIVPNAEWRIIFETVFTFSGFLLVGNANRVALTAMLQRMFSRYGRYAKRIWGGNLRDFNNCPLVEQEQFLLDDLEIISALGLTSKEASNVSRRLAGIELGESYDNRVAKMLQIRNQHEFPLLRFLISEGLIFVGAGWLCWEGNKFFLEFGEQAAIHVGDLFQKSLLLNWLLWPYQIIPAEVRDGINKTFQMGIRTAPYYVNVVMQSFLTVEVLGRKIVRGTANFFRRTSPVVPRPFSINAEFSASDENPITEKSCCSTQCCLKTFIPAPSVSLGIVNAFLAIIDDELSLREKPVVAGATFLATVVLGLAGMLGLCRDQNILTKDDYDVLREELTRIQNDLYKMIAQNSGNDEKTEDQEYSSDLDIKFV